MTGIEIYWLLMLDNIRDLLCILVTVGAISAAIAGVLIGVNIFEGDISPKWIIVPLVILTILVLGSFILALTPTTKQMATILVAPKIINNEQVQQIPDRVIGLANEWLEELSPKKASE